MPFEFRVTPRSDELEVRKRRQEEILKRRLWVKYPHTRGLEGAELTRAVIMAWELQVFQAYLRRSLNGC